MYAAAWIFRMHRNGCLSASIVSDDVVAIEISLRPPQRIANSVKGAFNILVFYLYIEIDVLRREQLIIRFPRQPFVI